MAKTLMNFKMDDEIVAKLKTAAVINKTSMTKLIEALLKKYLDQMTQDIAWEKFQAMSTADKLEFSRRVEAEAKKIAPQDKK